MNKRYKDLMPTPAEYDKIAALTEHSSPLKSAGGVLGTALGAGLGGASASSVAGYFGATTLFGSTALAHIAGTVIITSTPVGWTVGSIVIGSALGYSVFKLCKRGAKNEEIVNSVIEHAKKHGK